VSKTQGALICLSPKPTSGTPLPLEGLVIRRSTRSRCCLPCNRLVQFPAGIERGMLPELDEHQPTVVTRNSTSPSGTPSSVKMPDWSVTVPYAVPARTTRARATGSAVRASTTRPRSVAALAQSVTNSNKIDKLRIFVSILGRGGPDRRYKSVICVTPDVYGGRREAGAEPPSPRVSL
jgi:hypothetical protein